MPQNHKGEMCSCPHHIMVPLFLTLSGILLLLGALGIITTDGLLMFWSILLILLGIFKMFRCKCC